MKSDMTISLKDYKILEKALDSCYFSEEIYGNIDAVSVYHFDYKKVNAARKVLKNLKKDAKQ